MPWTIASFSDCSFLNMNRIKNGQFRSSNSVQLTYYQIFTFMAFSWTIN